MTTKELGTSVKFIGTHTKVGEKTEERLRHGIFTNPEDLAEQDNLKMWLNATATTRPEYIARLEAESYPLETKQVTAITFINQRIGEIMRDAGVEPVEFPLHNIRVLPPKNILFEFGEGTNGSHHTLPQKIYLNAGMMRVKNGSCIMNSTLSHEIQHGLAFHSETARSKPESEIKDSSNFKFKVDLRRKGWIMFTTNIRETKGPGHKQQYFLGIEEAVITATQKDLFLEMLNLPEMAEDKAFFFSEENQRKIKYVAEQEGIPIDEIAWVNPHNSKDYKRFNYPEQRKTLDYVCKEIAKQHENDSVWGPKFFINGEKDIEKAKKEVFKLFSYARFNGKVLEVLRLYEATFGKETISILASMNGESESAVICRKILQQRRNRFIKMRPL